MLHPAGVLRDASFKELLHMQISQWLIMCDGADVLTPLTGRLGLCVCARVCVCLCACVAVLLGKLSAL